MKRLKFLVLLVALLNAGAAMAIPAYPGSKKMSQPDGSSVTLRLVGDEYLHFQTTADGYSVVKDQRGYYVYAQLTDGRLTPTSHVAHDAMVRTAEEQAFLQSVKKYLAPQMGKNAAEQQQQEKSRRAARLQQQRVQQYDYTKFRGLILLIEYNDCSFKYDNYRDIMEGMVNQDNYHGTSITNISRTEGACIGSVRDYYRDCSNGLFEPEFDIVGPIKVDRSQYFYGSDPINDWVDNAYYLTTDAINAADSQVDFSKYDGDGDGIVDMVFFIFAGKGSNFSGNDERLLWPHAASIYNPYNNGYLRKDGKYLGRYACSTELYGWNEWTTLNGIGTICHEFGHVLGLPDFYDTDYEDNGGESHHPGEWSVMAGGGYMNYGRSPAVYTLFERYALGWAQPETISREGSFELKSIDESNTGYRINSQTKNEYFLFENRQQTKWNAYLPGHGMLVFRVDSTNANVWRNNTLNCNPKHNYFELVRAGGWQNEQGQYQFASDPFPGTRNVTLLNNTTSPAHLRSWTGKETLLGLENIAESSSGVITFDVIDVNVVRSVSLPESIVVGKGTSRQLNETRDPDYAPYVLQWSSDNEAVATISSTGLVTGISEGTATITVVARSPKQSEDEAVSASCQVIVEEQTVVGSIAEFKSLAVGSEAALQLNDAQLLYKYKGLLYVRDASGALVVSGVSSSWSRNAMLNGTLYGKFSMSGGMPELVATSKTDINGISAATGQAATPIVKRVSEVTEADRAQLLTISKAKMENVDGYAGIFATQGDRFVRVFNTFGAVKPKTMDYSGKRFDITGILVTRQLNGEIIDELAMLELPEEVSVPSYTLTYNVSEGGRILLTGTNTPLTGTGTKEFLEEDDVVLQIVADEGFELEGVLLDATMITPSEIEANIISLPAISTDHDLTVLFHEIKESGIEHVDAQLSAEQPVTVCTTGGTVVARTTFSALSQLHLPTGIYIVKTSGRTLKMVRP